MGQQPSARERITEAFFSMLSVEPLQKINVSSLIKAAKVNRSTFYRNYENTEDLMECVTEELQQKIAVEPPFAVDNEATLEQYANVMFDLAQQYHDSVAILSGEHGDFGVAYRIAEAVKNRLETAKNNAGIKNPAVENCLKMASPALSFYFITGGVYALPRDRRPLEFEIEYDRTHSMLANVSMLLSKRKGGTPFFHYDLLCAYVKLDAENEEAYRNITVSQLLATAGIARTEFYKYYRNISDFFEAFEDACVYSALYWLASFLKLGWPSEEDLKSFIRHDDVKVSITKFFLHGRVSTYFPRILNLVFRFVDGVVPGGLPEDKMVSFSYYVTVFAYAIVTYLIGMSDYTALKKTFSYLNTIRNKYNV